MSNEFEEFDPIQEYIGKLVQVRHNEREYQAKLIAIKGNELWFEAKNKQRWMVSRTIIEYIGIAGKQVA